MSDTFACTRCDRDNPAPLARSPFPTDLGQRIVREICDGCWEEWKQRQMLLINHYGLNLQEERAREFLYTNLRSFLFSEGEDSAEIDTSQEGNVSW
jgi:Fe-S cluster biosynthesis and repair protein YggX